MNMRLFATGVLLASIVMSPAANADGTVPVFGDYPTSVYTGVETPVRIDSIAAKKYAKFLLRADGSPVNFAGRYVFVTLPDGKGCATGAAIDIKTGHPNFLPFKSCAWDKKGPFATTLRSRLLLVSGEIDGKAGMSHYFSFEDGKWTEIAVNAGSSLQAAPEAPKSAKAYANIEPAAGDAGTTDRESLLKEISAIANDPSTGVHWGCYTRGLKISVDEVNKASHDTDSYLMNLLARGGFTLIAERVIDACDKGMPSDNADHVVQKKLNLARLEFLNLAIEEDKALFKKCSSDAGSLSEATRTYCKQRQSEFEATFKQL